MGGAGAAAGGEHQRADHGQCTETEHTCHEDLLDVLAEWDSHRTTSAASHPFRRAASPTEAARTLEKFLRKARDEADASAASHAAPSVGDRQSQHPAALESRNA